MWGCGKCRFSTGREELGASLVQGGYLSLAHGVFWQTVHIREVFNPALTGSEHRVE